MKIMNPGKLLVYILTVLTALPVFTRVASATTIDIFQTFDYPGADSTMPQKISDQWDLIGTAITADGKVTAFVYKVRKQRFSPMLSDPNDTGNMTRGRGFNNKRHGCGEYLNGSDGTLHGYFFYGGERNTPVFIGYDLRGLLQTIPLGLNNYANTVGSAIYSDGTQPAFVDLDGVVTIFAVPDATATFAYMLSDTNQIVGSYIDAAGLSHGFTRDSEGNLTYPMDMPGATETLLLGNNELGWVVGRYKDAAGGIHGLFYMTPDDIMTYDYPGATYTSLNGINKVGLICGYYGDAAGLSHGFVLRVNTKASGRPNMNRSMTPPVKPAYVLPDTPGITTPPL